MFDHDENGDIPSPFPYLNDESDAWQSNIEDDPDEDIEDDYGDDSFNFGMLVPL